jgi:hypothetical protein
LIGFFTQSADVCVLQSVLPEHGFSNMFPDAHAEVHEKQALRKHESQGCTLKEISQQQMLISNQRSCQNSN